MTWTKVVEKNIIRTKFLSWRLEEKFVELVGKIKREYLEKE